MIRAAASSSASGSPSRRTQSSATASAFSSESSKSGRMSRARVDEEPYRLGAPETGRSRAGETRREAGAQGRGRSALREMSSGARLVTRSVRPGASASSSASIGAASSTCSKLSSTSSARRPRSEATSASSDPRSGLSIRPSAPAIVVATRSASLIGASSTSTTPPGNSASRPVVASTASRVFPVPAAPVRVRRRTSARLSSLRISRSSRLRPTKEVTAARGFGAGRRAGGADATSNSGS